MMIITIASLKGGVGKTTTAVHLAVEAHRRHLRVLLADADPQRSALTWAEVAREKDLPHPEVQGVTGNLHPILLDLARRYDLIIVDVPPRGDAITRSAIVAADLTIIPLGPSPLDVWEGGTVPLVREAMGVRPELEVAILLTRLQRRQRLSAQASTAADAFGLPRLRSNLGLRTPFSEALAAGHGVTTYAPRSEAAKEIRALFNEIVPVEIRQRQRRKGK